MEAWYPLTWRAAHREKAAALGGGSGRGSGEGGAPGEEETAPVAEGEPAKASNGEAGNGGARRRRRKKKAREP